MFTLMDTPQVLDCKVKLPFNPLQSMEKAILDAIDTSKRDVVHLRKQAEAAAKEEPSSETKFIRRENDTHAGLHEVVLSVRVSINVLLLLLLSSWGARCRSRRCWTSL